MLKVEYRDHIGFENKRLENEIHSRMTAYRAAMGGEELTMMQSWIIRFLYEHSEEARSTATGILKLMEKRGYIRRVSVERDARLKKLELTEVGIRMQEGTIRNINRLESTLRQGISDEDLEVFFRVIRKMRSNIEIQQGETNRRRE